MVDVFGDGIIYHLGYAVRAVYRKHVLQEHGVRFPEQLIYGEDTTFMAEGVMYGKRVMAVDDVLYNYRQERATSSSAQLVEMKGERIYESIFRAGELVVALKDQAASISVTLANTIEKGLPWFVNRLLMRLVKAGSKERCEFYNSLINKESSFLICYMNKMNRFVVVYSRIGKIVLDILEIVYRLKHK